MESPPPRPAAFRWPRHRWLLLGLFAVHFAVNWVWWGEDLELAWLDESWHFIDHQYARSVMEHTGLAGYLRWLGDPPTNGNPFWPPVRTLPGALLTYLVQPSWVAHRLPSTLFLGPLLLSVYLLGRRFWSRDAGLAAAALASFYPMTFGASRHLSPDIIGAAFITGNLYLMFATTRFSRTGPSVLLGLCVGAGFLFRPHYPIFFTAPLLLYALLSLTYRPLRPLPSLLGNMAAMAAATVAASAPFWWNVLPLFFSRVNHYMTGKLAAPYVRPDATALDYYLRVLPEGASPPLFWASAAGAALLALSWLRAGDGRLQGRRVELALVILGMVSGFAFLCANDHNHLRHLAPLYPLLAVCCMVGIFSVLPVWPRRLAVAALLLASAGTWIACTYTSWRPRLGETRLVHCEPCWSREQTGDLETAGPADKDARFQALLPLVDTLRQRHGKGEGVLVRIVPPRDKDIINNYITLPVLLDLPALRIVSQNSPPDEWLPETQYSELRRFDDSGLRHHYFLVHANSEMDPATAWRPPAGARVVKRMTLQGPPTWEHLTLWAWEQP